MNILLVNTLYHPNVLGGAERSVQLLAEGLVALNHRVAVACCSMGQPDSTSTVNGVTVHYLKPRNVHSSPIGGASALLKPVWHAVDTVNPFMAGALKKIIACEQPDIVNTNTIGGFSVAAWRAAGQCRLPVVHTLRDYYLICPKTTMFQGNQNCTSQCKACKVFSWPRRRMSSRVAAVIGISEFLLNAHLSRNYFPKAAVRTVIRNAARMPAAAAAPPPVCRPDKIVLGYLGRLDPSKGITSFLDAAVQLPAERFEVIVAGKGEKEYEDMLAAKYAGANIRFLGFVSPEDLFRQIHVLVVPSLWNEPLGRIVLEAHSNHVPVVGSRRGGIPELVDEGKNGWLYEPDRPGELLGILSGITHQDCAEMQRHCDGKAAEYSPEHIASQYLSVYDQVLHAGSSR